MLSSLDDVFLNRFNLPEFQKHMEKVREQYVVGPDEEMPEIEVIQSIFDECCAFIVKDAFSPSVEDAVGDKSQGDFSEALATKINRTMGDTALPALADSFARYIVTGEYVGPAQALDLDNLLSEILSATKRKPHRPINQIMRAHLRKMFEDRNQKWTNAEMAQTLLDSFPEEFADASDEASKLKRAINRVKYYKRKM